MGLGGLFWRILRMFSKLAQPFAIHGTLIFLTTNTMIFYLLFLGTGRLSQGEGGAKRRISSKKRVPTDKYVWGV